MDQERLKHLTELADPALRGEAALRVAAHYGVDSIILFVRDDAIGISLPANGFPQTLPNGSGWQAFVKRCVEAGTASETLAIPGSPLPQTVTGIACKTGAVMAFIGGELLKDAYTDIPMILPVLDLALKGEQVVRIAQANALLATERIGVAHRLAESLDKARLDLAKTLIESRAAQQELKMADQRKNEFLALLAHELRNPLAPIGNALELLRVSIENPAMVAKVREIMQTQFTQMVHLIDDLMDVSRISTGKILLKKEVLNISEVLLNAVEAAKPHIDLNQHKLDIHLPAVSSVVFADRTRLNQVFLNILNNAAKFTPAGGRITVSASISANHIDVHVTDTGKGVPKEIAKQIFTMFAQGDDTISRTTGGLGIGLGLAKKLVEL
ncbi:MAG TPA: HAMP domain-containing sensor histidine kinase, partial [Patescibacteria group bacterium]|nr:HAMP domain-containing sensor histidine kinase [Patescibacteria group bacterium]